MTGVQVGAVLNHMRTDAPKLLLQQTVGEALDRLRVVPLTSPVLYFYVVAGDGQLVGVVPARALLLQPYDQPLADLMIQPALTAPSTATLHEAGQLLLEHKLLALPVVDQAGRMLGVIDLTAFGEQGLEVAGGKSRDDLFQRIGVHLTDAYPDSALAGFRHRFPWLSCNLGAGILAAFLSGLYQAELTKAVALTFFIPVVLNLAESVSSQSVSIALELMRGKIPTWASMIAKIRREATTGMLLGLGSGIVVGCVALAWLHQQQVALCLLGGIAGGVTGAAVLGLSMPYLLRLLKLEPQVAAGPIALAGADIVTLLIYLNLARWLIPI